MTPLQWTATILSGTASLAVLIATLTKLTSLLFKDSEGEEGSMLHERIGRAGRLFR